MQIVLGKLYRFLHELQSKFFHRAALTISTALTHFRRRFPKRKSKPSLLRSRAVIRRREKRSLSTICAWWSISRGNSNPLGWGSRT